MSEAQPTMAQQLAKAASVEHCQRVYLGMGKRKPVILQH
jgi:hypothetical protein